jgi:hypothetical protein
MIGHADTSWITHLHWALQLVGLPGALWNTLSGSRLVPCPFGVGVDGILSAADTVFPCLPTPGFALMHSPRIYLGSSAACHLPGGSLQ